MRVRKRLIGFIAIIQSVLFLTHFFLYETWTFSPEASATHGAPWIKLFLGFLSVSFVAASLLAFRYTNARFARLLQGRCGLGGSADFPLPRGGFLLDYFRSCAAGWAGRELPSDRGIAVRCCSGGRTLRGFQRKLDANHANDGAARESCRQHGAGEERR